MLIFILFAALILRLGYTQIVKGEEYEIQAEEASSNTVTQTVPRGVIYDRNHNVVVGNYPQRTITYTRSGSVKSSDMLKVSETLASLITMDTSSLTDRDKKDYWIMLNADKAKELVSEAEQTKMMDAGDKAGKGEDEINAEIYQLQLKRITDEYLATLSEQDLQVLAIYSKISSATTNTTVTIKSGNSDNADEGVTDKEFATVSEYLEALPGVDATTDWERTYPYDSTLRSVLGKVSSSEEGLPSDKIDYYLARNYSRNDRVGTSYIESTYEEVLHGTDATLEANTDDAGNITNYLTISEGASGNNLQLTLDIELQQKVEALVEEQLWAAHKQKTTADRAFVVMMNPNTGEVLAMVGKQIVTDDETGKDEMRDYALGTISSAYEPGSVVKGATLMSVWQSGAMKPGDRLLDEKLNIRGSEATGSYKTMGTINDLTALQKSSNVYMMKSVIAMGGGRYVSGQGLNLNKNLIDDLRYYFNQFGLGVKTGIDLANETAGYIGTENAATDPGKALFYSIGQYDTYTAMQLAQYVSTIANGGYRMKPQIIKAISESSADGAETILTEIEPEVLNKIEMSDSFLGRVQDGFKLVTQSGGTGYAAFAGNTYKAAGKTGTAEATKDGVDVENTTMVAYAPYDNPEIAISVVVPWVQKNNAASKMIARQSLDAYFAAQNGTDGEGEGEGSQGSEE